MNKQTIYFILGQTASGKTNLATGIAREHKGEMINCDSRQIYKYLDIITGKTDNPIDIPTHCIDLVEPSAHFSAYEYATTARKIIDQLTEENIMPVVVGGTGMYAYLLKYIDPTKSAPNIPPSTSFDGYTIQDLQEKIQKEYNFIWEKLNDSDKKNKRRLAAALHRLAFNTSEPIDKNSKNCIANIFETREIILLHKDQESLEARLRSRVENRIKAGAVEECQKLLHLGYQSTDPGLATIGYLSIFSFLEGKISESEMKEEWFIRERQYAKRQKTYLLKYFPQAEIRFV